MIRREGKDMQKLPDFLDWAFQFQRVPAPLTNKKNQEAIVALQQNLIKNSEKSN